MFTCLSCVAVAFIHQQSITYAVVQTEAVVSRINSGQVWMAERKRSSAPQLVRPRLEDTSGVDQLHLLSCHVPFAPNVTRHPKQRLSHGDLRLDGLELLAWAQGESTERALCRCRNGGAQCWWLFGPGIEMH